MALTVALPLYLRLMRASAGLVSRKLDRGGRDLPKTRQRQGEATHARPIGPLAWIHIASDGEALAVFELIRRLWEDRDDVAVLVTVSGEVDFELVNERKPEGVILQRAPADHPQFTKRFLDNWAPQIAVFTEDELRPALLSEVQRAAIPHILIDGRISEKRQATWRWLPGTSSALLQGFFRILTTDQASARRFRQMGANAEKVEVAGRLEESSGALPYDETERESLAASLTGRPVWLAAFILPDEIDKVIDAHIAATQKSHRLFLIVVPKSPSDATGFAEKLRAAGLGVSLRSRYEDLTDDTEALVVDEPDEMGLWYRLAPITFMGSSLTPGGGRNPFEPAALGSAILHGPNVSAYRANYDRLERAGAARLVRDTTSLALALEDLMAPDRAAAMAHAAWSVSSSGAEVTDRVRDLIVQLVDIGED